MLYKCSQVPGQTHDLDTFGMYPICYQRVSGRYFQPEPTMYSRCFCWFPSPLAPSVLRKFLGNSTAKFKTPEQAEAIEFVMAHQHHLLLVGLTVMGKTLAYMLPASQHEYGITCVLLPLSALHPDFDRWCKEIKIESSRWTPVDDRPATKIIYISPEHAQTKQFVNWLIESHNHGLLKQFVIDKAHLVIGHKAFCFCFLALKPLMSCGTFKNQGLQVFHSC